MDEYAHGDLTIQSSFSVESQIEEALLDDINTPEVITRLRELFKQARQGDSKQALALANTLAWLGLYRPEMHEAYSYSGVQGKDVGPYLLSKYRDAFLKARAIVLNEYRWKTPDYEQRQKSRLEIEKKINMFDSRMAEDHVRFQLHEHCWIELIPAGSETKNDEVETLIEARLAARKAKNWAEADRIRDELATMGIVLMDAKDPETGEIVTTWEIAR
jgi:cysteinyl-tRNA synthetase